MRTLSAAGGPSGSARSPLCGCKVAVGRLSEYPAMQWMVERVKRHETAANIFATVCAIYAAAGTVLLGADVPSKHFWHPWRWPFVLLLISVVVVPLAALYQYLDAQAEARAKENAERQRNRAQLDADMAIHCQQLAASLSHRCPEVKLDDVAISIWLCLPNGQFDRRYRFFLPYDRQPSGLHWRRGVGVAGRAWEDDHNLALDLETFNKERREMGAASFDALPEGARYGMSYEDFDRTEQYTGVIATRLFAPNRAPGADPLAVLVVDYSGTGQFDCLKAAMGEIELRQDIGAAARTLAEWQHIGTAP